MTLQFTKATKAQARLRLALTGPAGSGKTYTALNLAQSFGKVALVDTEHGSASKYADRFEFDTLVLDSFHPQKYIDAIHAAAEAGYDVLVLDSLSHAWNGKDGALELVNRAASKSASGNSYVAWGNVTPLQNQLMDTILSARLHIIATMRTKTEYSQEKDERGKTVIKKLGMAPVQRDGVEYEFDIVGDLDAEHNLTISKTRCLALDGVLINQPGAPLANTIKAWLTDGAPVPEPSPRDAKLKQLRAVYLREKELLDRLGQTQPVLTKEQVDAMNDDALDALIAQKESNVLDLHAARAESGRGGKGGR